MSMCLGSDTAAMQVYYVCESVSLVHDSNSVFPNVYELVVVVQDSAICP